MYDKKLTEVERKNLIYIVNQILATEFFAARKTRVNFLL